MRELRGRPLDLSGEARVGLARHRAVAVLPLDAGVAFRTSGYLLEQYLDAADAVYIGINRSIDKWFSLPSDEIVMSSSFIETNYLLDERNESRY